MVAQHVNSVHSIHDLQRPSRTLERSKMRGPSVLELFVICAQRLSRAPRLAGMSLGHKGWCGGYIELRIRQVSLLDLSAALLGEV